MASVVKNVVKSIREKGLGGFLRELKHEGYLRCLPDGNLLQTKIHNIGATLVGVDKFGNKYYEKLGDTQYESMDFRDGAHKLSRCIVTIGTLGLQLLWYFLQIIVSTWYFISVVGNLFESYFISSGVLKKYKSLHSGKVRYLAIVIESEEAYQISKVVKLLQWLDSFGVKNVCLYDMNGVLKKSKETIFQKLKNAKPIEEVSEVVTFHAPDHMTLEFLSYVDGKETVAKAANLIFLENLKRHNLGGELDQILLEPQLNEALQIVGSKGPEPDLLLVYGPVRSHLGFPPWRLRYTEIIHMGSLNFMRYGSLMKAIYDFVKVHQNYGT